MLRTDRWKYVHFKGFPPQLFDLENDPDEFDDLGRSPKFGDVCQEMHTRLFERLIDRKNRVAMTDEGVRALRRDEDSAGILIGKWAP